MKAPRLFCLLLLLTPLSSRAEGAGPAYRVAVLDLDLQGAVPGAVGRALARQLRRGLQATSLEVIPDEQLSRALGARRKRCDDSACWRLAAGKLGCRFVVGGTVRTLGEDRSYDMELWLADGISGEVLARVRQQCEICGLQAISDRMELAASSLRAKAQAAARAPARISIRTDPPGAEIRVDGDPVGRAPRQLELPPGKHQITARREGFLGATRSVDAVAGVEEQLVVKLIPAAPRRSWRSMTGWIVLGGAMASLVLATTLFALDGRPAGCGGEEQIPGGQCPRIRDTRAGAWTAAGLGIAGGVLGVYLLLERPPAGHEDASLLPTPGGALQGRF